MIVHILERTSSNFNFSENRKASVFLQNPNIGEKDILEN